jgi:hypothetical protein
MRKKLSMTELDERSRDEGLVPEFAGTLDLTAEVPQSGLSEVVDLTKEVPRSGPRGLYAARGVPGTHDQETRKQLALIILTLIAVFYAAILWCFLANWIDTAKFTGAIAAMSGIQALAAAAIGFYYGSKQD